MLLQQIDNMKLQYSLLGRQMDHSLAMLNSLALSDDKRYRPILEMKSLPEEYREGAVGGVERFSDLKGYKNSDLLISYMKKVEEIKNRTNVQKESFSFLEQRSIERQREINHYPAISPVNVKFSLGDGFRFRPVHPVYGMPRMHNGQDFEVPYGTEVYATGDGVVVEAGRNDGGFGIWIVIDHDYGLASIYGHLSQVRVVKGQNVKRGDLIGISGNTGASTGPHLHYQVEQQGHAINPSKYINIDRDLDADEYNEMIKAFGAKSIYR
jgi:murein DD-endopeptidase MepM/ murein hydrolase activator NlpD